MATLRQLDTEKEALVVQLLGEAIDLIELIADSFPQKGTGYFMESLFLSLRQMGYFFTERSSPLKSQFGALSAQEVDVAERIKTIRDAIGHRESDKNFAKPRLKIVGGMIFKNGDVELQYGKTSLFLLRDVISNYRRYRGLFRAAPELANLSLHPMWEMGEIRLAEANKILSEKLNKNDISELLRGSR